MVRWRMADGGWRMANSRRRKGRMMAFRFESLKIWHMARAYAAKVYALTARFPRHEEYGLTS